MAARILIVDDEQQIHKMVARMLSDDAYEVIHAYDGAEGLELAEKESPDLILLDINMPRIDGNEALRKLKSNGKTAAIPVMMVTSCGELVDQVIGYELGVEDYLTKPFDAERLRARVRHALK